MKKEEEEEAREEASRRFRAARRTCVVGGIALAAPRTGVPSRRVSGRRRRPVQISTRRWMLCARYEDATSVPFNPCFLFRFARRSHVASLYTRHCLSFFWRRPGRRISDNDAAFNTRERLPDQHTLKTDCTLCVVEHCSSPLGRELFFLNRSSPAVRVTLAPFYEYLVLAPFYGPWREAAERLEGIDSSEWDQLREVGNPARWLAHPTVVHKETREVIQEANARWMVFKR